MSDENRIENCERCGSPVNAGKEGYYKSPDEQFVHKVCYEEGEPSEVLNLIDEHPFMEQVPKTYNCGHHAHGPPRHLPDECPECGVPAP